MVICLFLMNSSIILVFNLSNPDFYYTGCFTCDKTNLHNIRGKAEKYCEIRNTTVLIRSAFDELNPNNAELIWKHLHLKMYNSGVGYPEVKVSSELFKCSRSKMYQLLEPHLEPDIEQRCILRTYEDLRNSTSFHC